MSLVHRLRAAWAAFTTWAPPPPPSRPDPEVITRMARVLDAGDVALRHRSPGTRVLEAEAWAAFHAAEQRRALARGDTATARRQAELAIREQATADVLRTTMELS